MEKHFKDVIKELLKNPRIKAKIEKTKLNQEQLMDAIPILIDMNEQKDDKNTMYLTSFFVTSDGSVKRIEERSSYWKQFSYLENVKSLSFENIDFEHEKNFIKEDSRKVAVNRIIHYLNDENKVKGLYVYGDMGVGKTFLLKRIAKKLAENGKVIAFVTVANLATKIKTLFNDNEGYWNLINMLKTVDFLFLDDIGAENVTTWYRDEILFSILNERMQNNKTTFFSSNYSMKKLEDIQSKTNGQKYRDYDKSARLLSRIKNLSDEILLIGTNKRI